MKYKGEPIKRNQYIQKQKASFISSRPNQLHGSQQLCEATHYQSHKNLFIHHPARVSEQKISDQKRDAQYLNIFEDDDLSDSNVLPKLENCKSSEDLRISFKSKGWVKVADKKNMKPKQSMQSTDSLKFPLKSVSQRNLHTPDGQDQGQYLVIRTKNNDNEQKQDNSSIKYLKNQIRKYEQGNKKIKQQNLQLRLTKMKLTSNSDIMTMIGLKAELRTLVKRLRELQGIREDSEYDNHSSINQNLKSTRAVSRLQCQNSMYIRSPTNSLKPSTTEIESIKKTNTPKLLKKSESTNRYSSPNIIKMQSSYLPTPKY